MREFGVRASEVATKSAVTSDHSTSPLCQVLTSIAVPTICQPDDL